MQNLYDYWDTILTAAANLRMELFHYLNYQDPNSPGGNAAITDFVRNPDLSPPTTGTFQANENANLKLIFPAVPVGTVIETKDHSMWATDYPMNTINACLEGFTGPPDYSLNNTPALSPISWNGIAGWVSPSVADFQSLITGWSGSDPNVWLTAQTQAVAPDSPVSTGFANFTSNVYNGCSTLAWTRTPTGVVYSGFTGYYLFYLINGETPYSGYARYPNEPPFLVFLRRSLSQGEQYNWYQ